MHPQRLTRPCPLPRGIFAAVALLIAAALLLAAANPASAVTRKQAAKRALAALGSSKGSDPVIVFGLTKPLRPGTRVTQAGSKRLVLRVGRRRAFFFYEDSGPFMPYSHPGRVALVGARSGRVRISKTIMQPPRVNGRVPAFLRSATNYRKPKYRVYARLASQTAPPYAPGPFTQDAATADPPHAKQPPKAEKQDVRVKRNVPKRLTLTASDAEGDFLVYEITGAPDHGTLAGQPPELTYTPAPNYVGKDKFAFKATDGESTSNTAHVTLDVVPLGSPPAMTTSAGCRAYTEQSAAVVVDGLLTVSDPDDTQLDSARVSIAANFQDGDDLLFTDQNGIISSYNDDTGILTLTGTASVATYQAALRTVRYRNLSNANPSATKDVAFTVNDAGSDSAPATKQICITEGGGGSNNKPIGETSEGALEYVENDGAVPIDPDFAAVDPDSTTLTGATVKFAPSMPSEDDEIFGGPTGITVFNFFPAEDELGFVAQNGITGSYDDINGVLTLSGTASVAYYQAAIRSVTYENSSENPSPEPRSIRFQLTDSSGANSAPSSRGILVTPVNDAPVVTTSDGTTAYTEGDPLTAVDSDLTVADVDDLDIEGGQVRISSGFEPEDELVYVDQLGISGVYNTGTGVLTLSGTASPADYQAALRSIEFRNGGEDPAASKAVEFVVNDGDLDSDASIRTISVTAVNDKPVLDTTDSALSYTEGDGPVTIDPGVTATDVDSATFAGATVQLTENFSLSEDALAFTDQNGISGFYDEETGTLTLSGSASVAEYEAALRSVTYENSSNSPSAARTVSFRVDDGAATDNRSDPATREISIAAVNDAPVVTTSDGSTSYTAGGPGTAVDSGLTVSDADDFDIESAQVRISTGFEPGDDLFFVNQLGISGVYNTGTGVLTLTGTAPVADYEAALRSIEYRHTGADPAAARTVEFVANDGDADSDAAFKAIEITAPPEQ